jgi:diadenosine tetraphosphate (Ap4A) HIT family hydrolase/8-oxo-dGTP pyrophosphatase MutT (NUDIX family)
MPPDLTPEDHKKQEYYRDARSGGYYDTVWQSTGKCVLCDLREKYVLFEENGVVMTISLYAYIDGHCMIVPRRHIRSPKELTQLEWETVRKFSHIAKKMIREVHGIKGMQLVFKDGLDAQSTIAQHLHFHCIPFDAPDLCQWDYRALKHTPLENVALYKKEAKKIVEHDLKFEKKYANASRVPFACDAILFNSKNEILFEERVPDLRFIPDVLVTPGGMVTDFDKAFEEELAREVQEETGLMLDPDKFHLVASRVCNIVRTKQETHLNVRYGMPDRFVMNTYTYERSITDEEAQNLRPSDDCEKVVWIPIAEVADHPRIASEIKKAIILASV